MFGFDPDIAFRAITVSTLIATIVGGLSLGGFLSSSNEGEYYFFSHLKSFIVLLVVGLSFLVPIFVGRVIDNSAAAQGWLGVMALWAVFSIAVVLGEVANVNLRKPRS